MKSFRDLPDRSRLRKHSVCPVVWLVSVFAIVAISACQASLQEATSSPVASPEPTAPSTFTVVSSGDSTVFTSYRHGFTVTVPASWIPVGLDSNQPVPEQVGLRGAQGDSSRANRYGSTFIAPNKGLVMVAVLSDGTTDLSSSVAQLCVAVAPAPDLTLDTFLAATEEELERFPGVINVGARIDDTLRPNFRPVAILSYVLTTRTVEKEPVAGYQVAFFDHNATNLIILTFTTNQDYMDDYLPDFEQIVRSVALS